MELVVLSGKGGTGKTTVATALSELAQNVLRVDCDVDAPNFYLFYNGKDIETGEFIGGKKAFIDKTKCIMCGKCESICRFGAIKDNNINSFLCEGCLACTLVCDKNAININYEKIANTFITELESGVISRAEMEIGSDGSGKLVNYLRKNGKRFKKDNMLTIVDASPGIGCSVISSITGSNAVLIVTEPTKSGLEDLKRIVLLCKSFGLFTMVCINKYDINIVVSEEIKKYVNEEKLEFVGNIPYDSVVVESINSLKPITYFEESIANKSIQKMWEKINNLIIK